MAKRAINWVEIQARYECGEPNREIVKDFKNLTSAKISDKAYRDKWVRGGPLEKTEKNREKVDSLVSSFYDRVRTKLDKLTEKNIDVSCQFMDKLEEQMDVITNPFLTDGERNNSLFQTAMNNATKLGSEHWKKIEDEYVARSEKERASKRSRVVVEFKRPEKRQ